MLPWQQRMTEWFILCCVWQNVCKYKGMKHAQNSESSESLSLCWSANVSIYCLTGIVLGVVLKTFVPMSNLTIHYMGFPGEVFMRVLQMVTIPLMVTSVITGASLWICHVIITIYIARLTLWPLLYFPWHFSSSYINS